MSDTVKWLFIPSGNLKWNLYNHLRITEKQILVYSYSKILFDENMDVKIPMEGYLRIHILNKDLQNIYTLFYFDSKLLFINQFIYLDKVLQEVLVKVDKQAGIHDLEINPDYSWLPT
ncbi:MAG: hypothetical protein OEY34_07030, partial [Cyclobacteriaceae bacterium]|nr:hypothetical protein [Cyclobacteriaceae bacterium]